MKNINNFLTVMLMASAGVFVSCEDQLNIPQQGVQVIDDFYKTDEQAINALADLYTQFRSTYSSLIGTLDVLADDSYGGWANVGDNAGNAHAFNTFTHDAQRGATMYSNPAGIIRRVNTILARLVPDTPEKKRVQAESKVMRAWAYSYMAQLFGDVPLFEEEITGLNAEAPRTPVSEVWALVNKDYEDAIASGDLPSKSSLNDKDNILRITKEAAQAWYGKSLLWQGKWNESATQLKTVINSGKYQLMGDAELKDHNNELDFGYIIRAKNNLSTEAIFEFNSKVDQTGDSGGSAYGGIGNSWRGDQLIYDGKVVGNIPVLNLAGNGWGGTGTSRKSLYDAFVEMEGPDGFRLKGSIMTWNDFQALDIGINGFYFSSEGYWDFKFRPILTEAGPWVAGTGFEIYTLFNSWKPMRYAEVLLNAAEACIRSNDAVSALTYINLVRERAHLNPLGSVTLTDIKKEKRLELYREGSRYIDLVRWEILGDSDGITASGMLSEQGKQLPQFMPDGTVTWPYQYTNYGWKKGKHELLPIPQTELNANRYIVQNPGY